MDIVQLIIEDLKKEAKYYNLELARVDIRFAHRKVGEAFITAYFYNEGKLLFSIETEEDATRYLWRGLEVEFDLPEIGADGTDFTGVFASAQEIIEKTMKEYLHSVRFGC